MFFCVACDRNNYYQQFEDRRFLYHFTVSYKSFSSMKTSGKDAYRVRRLLPFLIFTFYINGVRNTIEVIHNFAAFDRHFTFKLLFGIYFITGLIIKAKITIE